MIRPVGFYCEHPLQSTLYTQPTVIIEHKCPRCLKTFTGAIPDVLAAYRGHVEYSDHFFELVDCGCCGCLHFPEFDGDCREDWERF